MTEETRGTLRSGGCGVGRETRHGNHGQENHVDPQPNLAAKRNRNVATIPIRKGDHIFRTAGHAAPKPPQTSESKLHTAA